jgi:hypothetical protein
VGEWAAVKNATWQDEDFLALSAPARLIFLFSFTHNPDASMTGLSRVSERQLMRAGGGMGGLLPGHELDAVLEELGEKPMVRYDYDHEVLWCVRRGKHVSRSPFWLKGARSIVASMPKCEILEQFGEWYPDLLPDSQ